MADNVFWDYPKVAGCKPWPLSYHVIPSLKAHWGCFSIWHARVLFTLYEIAPKNPTSHFMKKESHPMRRRGNVKFLFIFIFCTGIGVQCL